MSSDTKLHVGFGYNRGIPDDVTAVWGARWIWPADQLPDRQEASGDKEEIGALLGWLNDGAGEKARAEARRLANNWELTGSEDREVVLYEDDDGAVLANPQSSHGYLYVIAFLTNEKEAA